MLWAVSAWLLLSVSPLLIRGSLTGTTFRIMGMTWYVLYVRSRDPHVRATRAESIPHFHTRYVLWAFALCHRSRSRALDGTVDQLFYSELERTGPMSRYINVRDHCIRPEPYRLNIYIWCPPTTTEARCTLLFQGASSPLIPASRYTSIICLSTSPSCAALTGPSTSLSFF
ncbi:hypothetical protein C8Q77DRAFT_150496 [Trametes polyzona]|nr:hypothetical protein C8Q77DRAFT_150496 [Trametes polyzona]